MREMILTGVLLIVQIVLCLFVKRRWVLLLLPALFFLAVIVPGLFYTYESVPAGESIKIKGVNALVNSLYVLVLLLPLAFTYVKKALWRVLLIALIVLIVPISFGAGTNVYVYNSLLYTVHIRHYNDIPQSLYHDVTGPYVEFEWNWPNEPYM